MPGLGRMNTRVALAHTTATSDGQTGFTETATVYATEWAEVTPNEGRDQILESAVQNQIQGTVEHLIRIHSRTDVRLTDQATWTDRFGVDHSLTVRGLRPDPDGVWLWLVGEESL